MILHALQLIAQELNTHLNSIGQVDVDDDNVVVGNISVMDADNYTPELRDRVVLTLVRIEEEKTLKNQPAGRRNMATGTMEYRNPPVTLNIYLLFTVNSNDYGNALTYLSRIIRFFQHKQVFTSTNTPPLATSLNAHDQLEDFRLIMDLYSPTFEEANYIWSVLGSKQLPSVMYKLRLLELTLDQVQAGGRLIEQIQLSD